MRLAALFVCLALGCQGSETQVDGPPGEDDQDTSAPSDDTGDPVDTAGEEGGVTDADAGECVADGAKATGTGGCCSGVSDALGLCCSGKSCCSEENHAKSAGDGTCKCATGYVPGAAYSAGSNYDCVLDTADLVPDGWNVGYSAPTGTSTTMWLCLNKQPSGAAATGRYLQVKNQGTKTTVPFDVTMGIQEVATGKYFYCTSALRAPGLAPGATKRFEDAVCCSFSVATLTAGNYRAAVGVDTAGEVSESNESNNISGGSTVFAINPAPDAGPTDTAPMCAASGSSCASTACCSGLVCGSGTSCRTCASSGSSCDIAADCCGGLKCIGHQCKSCGSKFDSCSSSADCCAGAGSCQSPAGACFAVCIPSAPATSLVSASPPSGPGAMCSLGCLSSGQTCPGSRLYDDCSSASDCGGMPAAWTCLGVTGYASKWCSRPCTADGDCYSGRCVRFGTAGYCLPACAPKPTGGGSCYKGTCKNLTLYSGGAALMCDPW